MYFWQTHMVKLMIFWGVPVPFSFFLFFFLKLYIHLLKIFRFGGHVQNTFHSKPDEIMSFLAFHSQLWPQMIRHAILNLIYGKWSPILWPQAWMLGWQKPMLEKFCFPSRWGWLMERFLSNPAPKSKLLCSRELKMEYWGWLFLAPNDYGHRFECHHQGKEKKTL